MSPTLLRILMQQRRGIEPTRPAPLKGRALTEARKERFVFVELDTQREFVELDTRRNDGYTVSLEWSRDTGRTQIVVGDIRTASQIVFPVPAANAGDAFRHPFRYAP